MSANKFIVYKRTNAANNTWHTSWMRVCAFKTKKQAQNYIKQKKRENTKYKIKKENGLD